MTVTFNKVSPDQKSTAGMPANAPLINANVAYEIVITSPYGAVSALGLNKRQVFFINTTTRSLAGVLSDMGKTDPKYHIAYPAAFAVPVQN